MSWEISVQIDQDQDDVGSISATWTDTKLGVFAYSLRVKSSDSKIPASKFEITSLDIDSFMKQAISERDKWQLKRQACMDREAILVAEFNKIDPKAGV